MRTTAESLAPGSSGSGVLVPTRYIYTARSHTALSSWNISDSRYTLQQMNLGYNPLSKIEVVSHINILSIGSQMYYYNTSTFTAKYAPKVYFGVHQNISNGWINDLLSNTAVNYTNWPQSYGTNTSTSTSNVTALYILL